VKAGFVFSHTCNPFNAIHHGVRRRFTSAGHLPHPRKILCLVTQRSSEHFHRRNTRRLTTHDTGSSFADFKKALRARLNITNGPLVIKQIDGDYTLDIETGAFFYYPAFCCFTESCARTEEEYEAFCHFAESASQLHVSVNGGLRDHSKVVRLYHAKHPSDSQRNERRTLPLQVQPPP
jgi:hypothetical protein